MCGWRLKYIIRNLDTNCRTAKMERGRSYGACLYAGGASLKITACKTNTWGGKTLALLPRVGWETSAVHCVYNTREETTSAIGRQACIQHVCLCVTPWRPGFLPPNPGRLFNHLVPKWSFLMKTQEPGVKTNRRERERKARAAGEFMLPSWLKVILFSSSWQPVSERSRRGERGGRATAIWREVERREHGRWDCKKKGGQRKD